MAETMRLKIYTPQRVLYDDDVQMVEFTTTEGQMGVYPRHVPFTAPLIPHVLTITEAGGSKKAAVHDGFIEVLQDKVTVLAQVAEWPDEIDRKRAEEAKIRAERRLASNDPNMNMTRAEMALRRALTRMEITK